MGIKWNIIDSIIDNEIKQKIRRTSIKPELGRIREDSECER
jgi:hypothetical protein